MKRTQFMTLVAALTCLCAHASIVITAVQSGGDVIFTGSGSANITDLTLDSSTGTSALIGPGSAALFIGLGPVDIYPVPSVPVFGSGGVTFASTASGDFFGFQQDDLIVPQGYVSGTQLSGSATYTGETFSSLGITPGMYTVNWGTGPNADSLTLNVVPEPSSIALLLLGFAFLKRLVYSRSKVIKP